MTLVSQHKLNKIKQPREVASYRLSYRCDNCGHSERISLPKGMRAGKRFCPNCGCHTFRKDDWQP